MTLQFTKQQAPQQQIVYVQAPPNGQPQQQVVYMQAPPSGQPQQQQQVVYVQAPAQGQVQPGIMAGGTAPQNQTGIISGEGANGGMDHPDVQVNTGGTDVYAAAITDEQRAYEKNPPSKHWKCAIFTLCMYLFLLIKAICAASATSSGSCAYIDGYGDLCGDSDTESDTLYSYEYDCLYRCSFPCNCESEGWAGAGWWFLLVGFYLFYIIEAFCCSSTRKYVSNIMTLEAITGYIGKMKQAAPVIAWHIECYHYRTTRTKNGTRRTKVVTHRANMNYQYAQWRDVSPAVDGLQDYGLTKLQYAKTFVFGNERTSGDYNSKRLQFIAANRRDVHQNFWMVLTVDGFQTRMLCEGAPGAVGSMISTNIYSLSTFLTFSWFYRKWLDGKCARKSHTWVKEISC